MEDKIVLMVMLSSFAVLFSTLFFLFNIHHIMKVKLERKKMKVELKIKYVLRQLELIKKEENYNSRKGKLLLKIERLENKHEMLRLKQRQWKLDDGIQLGKIKKDGDFNI